MRIIQEISSKIALHRKQNQAIKKQSAYRVQFYNFWDQPNEQMYWYQFLLSRRLLPVGKTAAFFSVFGDRSIIERVHADMKVFFTGENLKRDSFVQYTDHCLDNQTIDLAMGFEVFEHPRYIRFPLWMMDCMFPADSSEDAIRAKCQQVRFPNINEKNKFCSMIASNSADGLRKEMYEQINPIAHVDSAGKYMHNDDALQYEFGDDKSAYLQGYIFNICPENSSAYGYTTEKIFEAITAGCIPIYWGAEFADKQVINEDAVIRWNREDNGHSAVRQVNELYSNPKLLHEFLSQPRLLLTAEEYILDTFATMESKLRAILSN